MSLSICLSWPFRLLANPILPHITSAADDIPIDIAAGSSATKEIGTGNNDLWSIFVIYNRTTLCKASGLSRMR